jgi:hypothetical protein
MPAKKRETKDTSSKLDVNIEELYLEGPTSYARGTVGAELYKDSPNHPNYVCSSFLKFKIPKLLILVISI